MPDDALTCFHAALKLLWPRVSETPESLRPVFNKHFRGRTWTDIQAILDAEKSEHPDHVRPSFASLIERARGHAGEDDNRMTDWQAMLQALRWNAKKQRSPINTDNWDDDSLWRHSAISQDETYCNYWRLWHIEQGLPIPACLETFEPYTPEQLPRAAADRLPLEYSP